MTEDKNKVFESYFSNRSVNNNFYLNYNIPEYLHKILPKDKSSAILDIGCGMGQLISALKKQGFTDVEGIDISKEAINLCKLRYLDVFEIANLEDFCSMAKKRYDFIIMSHVLEHLEKSSIIRTLQLIKQYLMKPEGSLMVMVPNAQSNTGCYWAYEDFTHNTIFTAGSLCFVLKSAGFESIEFLDPDGLEASWPIIKWLRKFFLFIYKANIIFWNRVTNSSFHCPSPQIFTYELKALAK